VGICLANNPHSLQWNPFKDNQLVAACANRPGHSPISGILYFLDFYPENQVEIADQVQLNIGCDRVCFSERNDSTVMASCDDFALRLFDLKKIDCMYREFYDTQKVRSIDWDGISLELVLTGGMDSSVKIYDLLHDDIDVASFEYKNHDGIVLDAHWSTHAPFTFMCK